MKTFEEIINSGQINLKELEDFRLEQIEIEKQKLKRGWLIFGSVIALTSAISLFLNLFPVIVVAFIVGGIWFLVWWSKVKKEYVLAIKEELVKKLIKSIDESFGYQPNSFIPQNVFKESNIVKGFNRYYGEDYFFGKLDDIPIEFSQLNVQKKHDKSTVTLFNGIFISVGFKHQFQGRAAVVTDTMEKTFGSFGRFFQNLTLSRDTLLKFDNPDFEKMFAIYSNNENEAKQLISQNFQNYLIQLRQEISGGVFFSYNRDRFYVGLFNRQDIFKVDIKTPVNETTVAIYYNEITYILNIVLSFYSFLEENTINNL